MSNRLIVPPPDDSLLYFQKIKQAANKSWRRLNIEENCWGLQIQAGTKWRDGLSETAMAEFETTIGYEFPLALKNYYKTMNGLDTPGIDVRGSEGALPRYGPIYYSYPDDLDEIKKTIDWVLNANHVSPGDLPAKASRIFPIMGHRFLLIDDPKHRVLSMHGDDIIYWSNSLSELLLRQEFPRQYYSPGFDRYMNTEGIKFWLDRS
jgi:hypothetical protein